MHKQNGSILTVFIAAIILLASVSGICYYVYSQSSQSKDNSATQQPETANTAESTGTQQNTEQTDATKYLVIKEWGVKIPLTDLTKNATYRLVDETDNEGKVITINRYAYLVVPFSEKAGCNEQAALARYAVNENPPEYMVSDTWRNGDSIQGYYYIMSFSQSACVEDFDTSPIQKQASEIRAAWGKQNGKVTAL